MDAPAAKLPFHLHIPDIADLSHGVATRVNIIVASTERSGSTMFCRSMAASGLLGAPEEYFHPTHAHDTRAYFGLPPDATPHALADAVRRRRTTPEGVFSTKLHYGHLRQFRTLKGLARAFPEAVFLQIVRRDSLAQAISFSKAMQTGIWQHGAPGNGAKARYDFAQIDQLHRKVLHDRAAWARVLAQSGRPVLRFDYEDLIEDLSGPVASLAALAGVQVAADALRSGPPIARQGRDAEVDAWRARYVADSAGAVFPPALDVLPEPPAPPAPRRGLRRVSNVWAALRGAPIAPRPARRN